MHRDVCTILRALAFVALGSVSSLALAVKTTSNLPGKVLAVAQTVDLAPGYLSSIAVTTGTTRYSSRKGLSISNTGNLVVGGSASSITPIQPVTVTDEFGQPLLSSDLLPAATTHLVALAPTIGARLRTYMRANGISTGTFSYTQKVMVESSTTPMHIVWQLLVDPSGKLRYGDAALVSDAPKYNNAIYVSLAVDEALPSSFAYLNAGFLVSSAAGTANVFGAYDAPLEGDPDAGLKCLINKRSSGTCPTSHPDMLHLLGVNGSTNGVLDYVRRLAPVYDDLEDASTGETIHLPHIWVRTNSRVWTPERLVVLSQPTPVPSTALRSWYVCADGDQLDGSTCTHTTLVTTCVPGPVIDPQAPPPPPVCTTTEVKTTSPASIYVHMPATFRTAGEVEYELQSTVDRYTVKLDGTYQHANSATTKSTQIQAFDKTLTMPEGTSCSTYLQQIINPFEYKLHPTDPENQPQVPDTPPSTFAYAAPNSISDLPPSHFTYVAPMQYDAYTSPAPPHPSYGGGSGCP